MLSPKINEKDCFAQEQGIVRVAFDLPEALPYIIYLRKTMRCLMDSLGIGSPDADEIELVIAELASNAARHAKCESYAVTLELSEQFAIITVTDKGVGFSMDNIAEPGTKRSNGTTPGLEERIGGFGLPLVFSLADEVDIEPNLPAGITVRARKQLRLA